MNDLAGKLALVTGGARNVGRAIVHELAARGAHVLVNYFHSHDEAKATKAGLERRGATAELFRASVGRPEQVERMFAEIEARHGRLDILVNNAASGALVPLEQLTEEHLNRAIDTNYKGALWCARHAAPLMAGHGGSIVNVSALGSSQLVMANYLACAPAKAALETLTRYLAVEFAPLGIRVNTASAAMLVSEVADSFPRAAEMRRVIEEATPLGRLGTAEEFAQVIAFLAADQSRWITGQVVLADGGLSLGSALLSPPKIPAAEAGGPPPRSAAGRGTPARLGAGSGDPRSARRAEDAEPEIAVVGMGLAVPGASTPGEFWDLRLNGADLFVQVPAGRWRSERFYSPDQAAEDKAYQDTCGFITGPQATEGPGGHDLTTRWLRHSLVQALESVQIMESDRCSFTVGYTPDGSQHLEEASVLAGMVAEAREVLAGDPDGLAKRIIDTLGQRYARGCTAPDRYLPHRVGRDAMEDVLPSGTDLLMIDTACSSSLYAVDIGGKGIRSGRHDVAVCGGAFALAPRGTVLFSKLHGLSERGEVRSLDASADGVLFADGAAVVVLKALHRAVADGDRVLAVIGGTGTSSDGKGKAIYAPNAAGQELAIDRAFDAAGVRAADVDWIVAHATGTPAGDLAEISALRDKFAAAPVQVTSNKSLIGHTGWAAGVVSLIEVILALRHDTIPHQLRFNGAPADFELGKTTLRIPASPVPWLPEPDRRRTAAVSGFGFGGTNAHMIVTERGQPDRAPAGPPPAPEPVAIVGWAAHLPGLGSAEQAVSWILGRGAHPEASFGARYPAPPFERVRLPASTVRTIDRCQLMILECAHDLKNSLGALWDEHMAATGTFIGHMGPTRAAMLYANRCYLDDIAEALRRDPALAAADLEKQLRSRVTGQIPAATEDAFPGMMPNVIAARVASYFGLNGANMTVDTGHSSTLSALDVACRYLRSGDVDLALAGGINGNSLPGYGLLLSGSLDGEPPDLAEGAFLFALTSEELASRHGLPVLGRITGVNAPSDGDLPVVAPGGESLAYLGASHAVELLRRLHGEPGDVRLASGDPERLHVDLSVAGRRDTDGSQPARTGTAGRAPDAEPVRTKTPAHAVDPRTEPAGRVPDAGSAGARGTEPGDPGESRQVQRYVPVLEEDPQTPTEPPVPFLTGDEVLLTDRPELLGHLPAVPALVLSTSPVPPGEPSWHYLPEITPERVGALLRRHGAPVRHLRVLTDLTRSAPPGECAASGSRSLEALHDLAFLVSKQAYESLAAEGSSVVAVLLGAHPHGVPHPYAGIFTGLVKCLHLEFSGVLVFALCHDETDAAAGARAAERESATRRRFPVVHIKGGVRQTLALSPAEAFPARDVLTADSVVLAAGGARGITAEVTKELARRFRPRIYLFGSNPLHEYPRDQLHAADDGGDGERRSYIREQLATRPRSVAEINHNFDRILDARRAQRNIEEMRQHCGADRVTYISGDLRSSADVQRAVTLILGEHSRVDLLINAPGRNRSALIKDKDFAEFQEIRDIKLRGHRNLTSAFAGNPPRIWCNFGSLLGFFGQLGEADYTSANDYLGSAARYASAGGERQFTIGWTLWDDVGMGAGELIKGYYERAGFYTHMTTGEGVRHFLDELGAADQEPLSVHLGSAERQTVEKFYPGYLREPAREEAFYLRRRLTAGPGERRFECTFDLSSDAYLRHHTVGGHPTLPGSFVAEIAAEAAQDLVPGLEVTGFDDLVFHHFLRVYEGVSGAPKKISAAVLDRTGDLTRISVRISTDVVSPRGHVLAKDKPHFEATVRLAAGFPAAPPWQEWTPADEVAVPDPYLAPSSPVLLSGPFAATSNARVHPQGQRARFTPSIGGQVPWTRFTVPVILLDALARTGVLGNGAERVRVPLSIGRIDLYRRANDLALARNGGVELYATADRLVATDGGGHVIAQISELKSTVLGHVAEAARVTGRSG